MFGRLPHIFGNLFNVLYDQKLYDYNVCVCVRDAYHFEKRSSFILASISILF